MDRELKREIMQAVRVATEQVMTTTKERWITGEELSEKYQFFTKSWLRYYGRTLPRTQAIVRDADGTQHKTGWCYAEHKIGLMIQNGDIKNLINSK